MALTLLAAALAVGMSSFNMFGIQVTQLGMRWWEALILCGFLESAQLAEAIRARMNYAASGRTGADGLAMWILAIANSVISGWQHATRGEFVPAMLFILPPLVATLLWHRSVVVDQYDTQHRRQLRMLVDTSLAASRSSFITRRLRQRRLQHALLNAGFSGALAGQGEMFARGVLNGAYGAESWTRSSPVPGPVEEAEAITASAVLESTAPDIQGFHGPVRRRKATTVAQPALFS